MGVFRLGSWVAQRYRAAVVENVTAESRLMAFDCLYIDVNCLFYDGIFGAIGDMGFQRVAREIDVKENSSMDVFDAITTHFFDALTQVVSLVGPTKLLYLAVDGPAPDAKLAQQRKRRYSAGVESMEKSKVC